MRRMNKPRPPARSARTDGSGTALKVISSTKIQSVVQSSDKSTVNVLPVQLPLNDNVPRVSSGMAFGFTVKFELSIVTVVGR